MICLNIKTHGLRTGAHILVTMSGGSLSERGRCPREGANVRTPLVAAANRATGDVD